MKLKSLSMSLAFPLICLPASAAPADDPAHEAQAFYDGYIKILNARGDTRRYVMKSASVTPGFKKVYAAAMKEPDIDPIIAAQDYPNTGFMASRATIKGDTAMVKMSSRDASFRHSINVTLVKMPEGWGLSGIDKLKGN